MAFLRDVCSSGGDWATLALSSSYDVIMKRPPDRLHALQVVLEAATGPDPDIRQARFSFEFSQHSQELGNPGTFILV